MRKNQVYRKAYRFPTINDIYEGKDLKNRKKRNSHPKRMSGDTNDFKTKWKTEICHHWEVNGFCKYGDNVRDYLN